MSKRMELGLVRLIDTCRTVTFITGNSNLISNHMEIRMELGFVLVYSNFTLVWKSDLATLQSIVLIVNRTQ